MIIRKDLFVNLIGFILLLEIIVFSTTAAYAGEEEYEDLPLEIFEMEVFESGDVLPSSSGKEITEQIEVPVINAAAGIVMDMKTGRILFEKNAYRKMPIASTTKIMTAILAIEMGNLDDIVTVSKRASSIGGSVINLRAGEEIKLKDLLYGLMLRSGNDAALAIAEHIGGSVENFVEMMNYKAKLLGARNTNFVTPHGLDREGHYSTAYDLAVITRYALQNPLFSQIVGTKNIIAGSRNLYNTNEMLDLYPGADGVKTGYTGQAGRCLVTSATRDGQRYISVVLNCPTRAQRAQSSKKILDYAFNNYKPYTLLKSGEKIAQIAVIKGIEDIVGVEAVNDISIPLRADEYEKIEKKVIIPEYLEAPVYAGVTVGEVQFFLDGKLLAQSELKTSSDISFKDYKYYIKMIIEKWMKMVW